MFDPNEKDFEDRRRKPDDYLTRDLPFGILQLIEGTYEQRDLAVVITANKR